MSNPQPFLPNLCTLQPVFLLVLIGELLAVALTIADTGVVHFQWQIFGMVSFLVQWIVLLSAALLCPLRFWLGQVPPWLAGLSSYLLVLAVTALCAGSGSWIMSADQRVNVGELLTSLMIAAIFAGIVLRYLYVQQQLANQKEAEMKARIDALQSRIRPHFLFNSMNSIASLIEVDPDKAEKMVVDLSSLFRASLAEPGLVSLADELTLCRRYLAIEQLRLGERLQIEWPPADAIVQIDIPSLLLQPIVENAVYHGIQPRAEGGLISLKLSSHSDKLGDKLCIEVSNPQPQQQECTTEPGNRIALGNISSRLQAYYGEKATLAVEQRDGLFITTLVLPMR